MGPKRDYTKPPACGLSPLTVVTHGSERECNGPLPEQTLRKSSGFHNYDNKKTHVGHVYI